MYVPILIYILLFKISFNSTCMHIIFHSSSHFPLEENNMHVLLNTWIVFSHVKWRTKEMRFCRHIKGENFLILQNTLQSIPYFCYLYQFQFYSFCCSTKRKLIIIREIQYYSYQINKHYTFNCFIFYLSIIKSTSRFLSN